MPKKLDNWNRLHSVIVWSNHTTNSFARQIGLSRAENLYQIKRGNYGISVRLADMIVAHYPQISKLWLLTGDGEMMVNDGRHSVILPFYDEDVCRATGAIGELLPVSDIVLPRIYGHCDLAMRHDDEQTEATSTLVLLRRCEDRPHYAAGEYVTLDARRRGRIVRIAGDGSDRPFTDGEHIVCEVVGRIVLNNPPKEPATK